MTNRDANRGGCAHSCRWNYSLFSNGKNLNLDDVFFSMGSRDLCAVSAIPELIDLGVKSLKIEGRMKSLYYIATVVRGYRMLIDDYLKNPENFDVSKYKDEIAKAENRATGTGFLFHQPGASEQVYNNESLMPTKEFIGLVLDYDPKTQTATVQERNCFEIGDEIEFFGPKSENQRMIIREMGDETTDHLVAARHALQVVKMKVDFPVSSGDMIRKLPRTVR
jgi:putative protease